MNVDHVMVEAPLLLSEAGAAVTLLNWTGKPLESLAVAVQVPFDVRSVESIRRGRLDFEHNNGRTELSVPLDAADILLLKPQLKAAP